MFYPITEHTIDDIYLPANGPIGIEDSDAVSCILIQICKIQTIRVTINMRRRDAADLFVSIVGCLAGLLGFEPIAKCLALP